jgi:hypothetical protein
MDLDPVPYPTIELQVNARRRQNFVLKHHIFKPYPYRYFLETLVDFDEFSEPEFPCFAI